MTIADLSPDNPLPDFDFEALKNKRVLVTGSQGMLGKGLSVMLSSLIIEKKLNFELFLASRYWNKKEVSQYSSRLNFITNEQARDKTIAFDVIIHCASPSNITKISNLEELLDINTGYLKDCISPTTNKVVFISSGEIYGGKSTEVSKIQVPPSLNLKRNWYPFAKLAAEETLAQMSASSGFSMDVIRLFHTFGPGIKPNDGRSFADILYGAATSRRIVLKSSGTQVRSFLYLTDALRAILMCVPPHPTNRILNVGSPQPMSIIEFAEIVAVLTDSRIETCNEDFQHSPFNEIIPDISEAQDIGWVPEVSPQEAIYRTLNWIKREDQ